MDGLVILLTLSRCIAALPKQPPAPPNIISYPVETKPALGRGFLMGIVILEIEIFRCSVGLLLSVMRQKDNNKNKMSKDN